MRLLGEANQKASFTFRIFEFSVDNSELMVNPRSDTSILRLRFRLNGINQVAEQLGGFVELVGALELPDFLCIATVVSALVVPWLIV